MKAVTASLEYHQQLRINRDDMQVQLATKVMAQVQASLGEQAIEDMCDQIMADLVEDAQRDLCLQLTKATISKLVTKMVAAHLNHQYSKNLTCRQSEITNGQQDQLVSMVLKAVQATLHLQVMKEIHEHFSKEVKDAVEESCSSQVREAVEDRLRSEVAEVVQQQQEVSEQHMESDQPGQSSQEQDTLVEKPVVTEVVGLVRDALHLQLRSDIYEQVVSSILDEYVPD